MRKRYDDQFKQQMVKLYLSDEGCLEKISNIFPELKDRL